MSRTRRVGKYVAKPVLLTLTLLGMALSGGVASSAQAAGQDFSWPATGVVTQNAAEHRRTEGESAIDIATPGPNVPVVAAHDGVVQTVSIGGNSQCHSVDPASNGLGNYVVLRHDGPGGTLYSVYAHLASATPGLSTGQNISEGTQLGIMGFTGCVIPSGPSGQHVHFAISTRATIFGATLWNAPDPVDGTHVTSGQGTGGTYNQLAVGGGGGGPASSSVSYTGPTTGGFSDSVTLVARLVSGSPAAGVGGRSMTFTLGTQSCSGTTDGSGNASCSLTLTQAPGAYTVMASFVGDASFSASSDSKPFTITRAATVTTLSAVPPGSSKFGQPVTFTAVTTTGASPGAPAPTGSTAFAIDGTPAGSSALVAGSASITTAALPAGPHTIAATYGGDPNFLPSSGALAYTVTCDVNISGTHQGALIVTASTCLAAGARVNGAVIVKPGGALDVEGATITGAIGATGGPGEIRVCGGTIGGAVDVKSASGLVIVGDPTDGCAPNTIGGALDVQNNANGVEAIDNSVGGAILTDGNSGPGPLPGEATTIAGNHHPAIGVPGVPAPPGGQPGAPASEGVQSAAQGVQSPPGATAGAAASISGGAPASVASTQAVAVGGSPHVVTAKRLTQAQKLATAINACNKLNKAKRRSCVATARKRYPPPAKPPTSKGLK